MKRIAFSIMITVTIFMAIPIWGIVNDPINAMRANWEVYLLFLIIPYSVAVALLIYAKKRRRR